MNIQNSCFDLSKNPYQMNVDEHQNQNQIETPFKEFIISLYWNNIDDLDLHVICPCGEKINYKNKTSKCGGYLQKDANGEVCNISGQCNTICNNPNHKLTNEPEENIIWNEKPPNGRYIIIIENYQSYSVMSTPFRCIVRKNDDIIILNGSVADRESIVIYDNIINFN